MHGPEVRAYCAWRKGVKAGSAHATTYRSIRGKFLSDVALNQAAFTNAICMEKWRCNVNWGDCQRWNGLSCTAWDARTITQEAELQVVIVW